MEKLKQVSIGLSLVLVGIFLIFALFDWIFIHLEQQKLAYKLLESQALKRDSNLPTSHWNRFSKCIQSTRQTKEEEAQKISQIKICLNDYQQARKTFYAERESALSQEINQSEKPSPALYFSRGNAYQHQGKCWRAIRDYHTACSLRDEVACHLISMKKRCSSNLLFYWGDLMVYNHKPPDNEFLDPNKRKIPIIEKLLNDKNPTPQPVVGDGYQSFAPY